MTRRLLAMGAACLALGGCAVSPTLYPRPTDARMSEALNAVTAVERLHNPPAQAIPFRDGARRQYEAAVVALRQGEHRRSALLLDRAQADAELGVALARRARAVEEERAARARLEAARANAGQPVSR